VESAFVFDEARQGSATALGTQANCLKTNPEVNSYSCAKSTCAISYLDSSTPTFGPWSIVSRIKPDSSHIFRISLGRVFEMFSPAVKSVRTSRKRGSESIPGQPSSKRIRKGIEDDTFVPLPESAQENRDNLKKTALLHLASTIAEAPGPQKDIAVRAKKTRSGDRANKGDGSIVLVCTFDGLVENTQL
jgi:hypothetical protein